MTTPTDARAHVGLSATHRRYVSYAEAHYAGNLVDGAWGLGLFGDVATEVCIVGDGDEGLFAGYEDVRFVEPVRAGDVVEATATVVAVGRRSRRLELVLTVVARGTPDGPHESSARVLDEPLVATTATGTVVVPLAPSSPRES